MTFSWHTVHNRNQGKKTVLRWHAPLQKRIGHKLESSPESCQLGHSGSKQRSQTTADMMQEFFSPATATHRPCRQVFACRAGVPIVVMQTCASSCMCAQQAFPLGHNWNPPPPTNPAWIRCALWGKWKVFDKFGRHAIAENFFFCQNLGGGLMTQ